MSSCLSPMRAMRLASGDVVFVARHRHDVVAELELACGNCMPCRVGRARDWSARCSCEAACWRSNASVCLTFDDEHLPADGLPSKRTAQLWLKRLRKAVAIRARAEGTSAGLRGVALGDFVRSREFRYFLIGERSPAGRAHFHVLLFNWWPADAVQAGKSRGGGVQYESAELSKSWGFGFCNFQAFSAGSASYVAGYYTEKLSDDGSFMLCSRGSSRRELRPGEVRGGIGAPFLARYGRQIREGADFVVLGDGSQVAVPAFFERRLAKLDPVGSAVRAEAREAFASERAARDLAGSPGCTRQDRTEVAAECLKAKRRDWGRGGIDEGRS